MSSTTPTPIDCPICMDCIVSENNKVTTECGHCFHTNCLMANIAHNGFGCPYCRSLMAEEPEDNDDDDHISVISFEESSINSSVEEEEEDNEGEEIPYSGLRSIRRLFQEPREEEDDEEEEDYPKPPLEYLVQKLVEEGFTIERLVKSWLTEHDEYEDIEEECLDEADKLFDSLRILISNYTTPTTPVVVVATPEVADEYKAETSIEHNFMRSSYA